MMIRKGWRLIVGLAVLGLVSAIFACGRQSGASHQFAYVANGSDGSISMLSVNENTGAVSFLGAMQTGKKPSSATVDPSGRFLFVPNAKSNDVSVFAINPKTGRLTLLQIVVVTSAWGPSSVLFHPSGQFAYVVNGQTGSVSGFEIGAASGIQSELPGSPFRLPQMRFADHAVLDESGRFAYLTSRSDHMIAAFTVNSASGAWMPIDAVPPHVGAFPGSLTVEASGRFAYVMAQRGLWVYAINRESGELQEAEGSPFEFPVGPELADHSGKFLFAGAGTGVLFVYRVDESTGMLRLLGGPSTAHRPVSSLAFDPTGRVLYATNVESDQVFAFRVEESGTLTPVKGSPFAVIKGARAAGAKPSSGEYSFTAEGGTWIALTPRYK